jgi:hypothetical protein
MHLSSFLFQVTLSQEDFRKMMQVLKENFAEAAALQPPTLKTVAPEVKWSESKTSVKRPSTIKSMLHRFFATATRIKLD